MFGPKAYLFAWIFTPTFKDLAHLPCGCLKITSVQPNFNLLRAEKHFEIDNPTGNNKQFLIGQHFSVDGQSQNVNKQGFLSILLVLIGWASYLVKEAERAVNQSEIFLLPFVFQNFPFCMFKSHYNIPRSCFLNRSPVPAMDLKSNRSGLWRHMLETCSRLRKLCRKHSLTMSCDMINSS